MGSRADHQVGPSDQARLSVGHDARALLLAQVYQSTSTHGSLAPTLPIDPGIPARNNLIVPMPIIPLLTMGCDYAMRKEPQGDVCLRAARDADAMVGTGLIQKWLVGS